MQAKCLPACAGGHFGQQKVSNKKSPIEEEWRMR